jgi:hypothetical protein
MPKIYLNETNARYSEGNQTASSGSATIGKKFTFSAKVKLTRFEYETNTQWDEKCVIYRVSDKVRIAETAMKTPEYPTAIFDFTSGVTLEANVQYMVAIYNATSMRFRDSNQTTDPQTLSDGGVSLTFVDYHHLINYADAYPDEWDDPNSSISGALTFEAFDLANWTYWNGTSFVGAKEVDYWNGTSFVKGTPHRWNGTSFVEIT